MRPPSCPRQVRRGDGGLRGLLRRPLTPAPPPAETTALEVRLLDASHTFEISNKGTLIASGEWPPGLRGAPAPGLALPALRPSCRAPPSAGKVYQWEDSDPKFFDSWGSPAAEAPAGPKATSRLLREDVYKELRLRGYDYGPLFQGICEASFEGGCAAPHSVLGGESRGQAGGGPTWAGAA